LISGVVASIIQLHNKGQTGCYIVTTLLQGTERKDWDKVWKHMRVAVEGAAAEKTGGPTTRVRDRLMTYGQLLRHKKEGISGIYPMNMPGHWRVMIVTHVRQVLLLDPFGDASEPVRNERLVWKRVYMLIVLAGPGPVRCIS
jgi:hypothetical protein